MSAVRIAVAGAGVIGVRHIEEIQSCSSTELASIVDPSPSAAALAAAEGVTLYGSLIEMLAAGGADGVQRP